MSATTMERIKSLRANREGRYHDLVIEAGVCDASGNGRELTHDDLRDLDETALLLGKTERTLADDLNAATRFHALTRQVTDGEAATAEVERRVCRLEGQIKVAVEKQKTATGALNGNRRSTDKECALATEQRRAMSDAQSEVGRLRSELPRIRTPIGRAEVAKRLLDELVTRHLWVRGGANGR